MSAGTRREHPLAFLADRSAFVRRFVLAEVLGPRRGLRPPRPAPAPVTGSATPTR